MVFFSICYSLFENFERASVSLLMLSAKQWDHWYLLYNLRLDYIILFIIIRSMQNM